MHVMIFIKTDGDFYHFSFKSTSVQPIESGIRMMYELQMIFSVNGR